MTPTTAEDQDIVTVQDYYAIANLYWANKAWGKALHFFKLASTEPGNQFYWDARNGVALAQIKSGKMDDAGYTLAHIMANAPTLQPYAFNVNGILQEALGQWVLAETEFKTAISLAPTVADFHVNLAHLYQVLGRVSEAEACYDAVIKLDPTKLEARFYRALAILTQGRFEEGFKEYELRYATAQAPVPLNGKPIWRGEQPLTGKAVLICAEQGIGDSVMCVRYARWLKVSHRAARVSVLANRNVSKLLDFADGVDFCVDDPKDAEPYDFNIPMMSLPGLSLKDGALWYGPTEYLEVPGTRKFLIDSYKPKVGFCWKGNPLHGNDRYRSIVPELFDPLLAMDLTPVSLQHKVVHGNMLDPKADSIYELAQQILCLDLVITVDTAVAHLAGALGVETWVLMYPGADWRWQLESTDTPWYPTMRLFRAKKPLEWSEVIEEISYALQCKLEASI